VNARQQSVFGGGQHHGTLRSGQRVERWQICRDVCEPACAHTLQECRRQQLHTVLAAGRPAEHHLGRLSQQLREQETLLVMALALDGQIGQHATQAHTQRIREERILRDDARKSAAVHAEQEDALEDQAARFHDSQHLNATAGATQGISTRALQRAQQQPAKLLVGEFETARARAAGICQELREKSGARRLRPPAKALRE